MEEHCPCSVVVNNTFIDVSDGSLLQRALPAPHALSGCRTKGVVYSHHPEGDPCFMWDQQCRQWVLYMRSMYALSKGALIRTRN